MSRPIGLVAFLQKLLLLENLFAAFAYRTCSNSSVWAEKADYSECLDLISHIPSYEVERYLI